MLSVVRSFLPWLLHPTFLPYIYPHGRESIFCNVLAKSFCQFLQQFPHLNDHPGSQRSIRTGPQLAIVFKLLHGYLSLWEVTCFTPFFLGGGGGKAVKSPAASATAGSDFKKGFCQTDYFPTFFLQRSVFQAKNSEERWRDRRELLLCQVCKVFV